MDSVLVLIAAPGSGAITERVVKRLKALGADGVHWLSPGDAAEVPAFPRLSEFLAEIREAPIDFAVVSTENRRKRLLVADMDSTMIHQECIDELGVAAGAGEEIKGITARAMRGELDFEGALRARVGLLKGLEEKVIQRLLNERITFMPGGKTLLATMKAFGAHTALISGGFRQFTRPVAKALGFDEEQANELEIKKGHLTGQVIPPILGSAAKLHGLKRLAAGLGLEMEDTLAVGDGANDVEMLSEAGIGVALHAKPHVQESTLIRINHGDLTALLHLQGYTREQFIAG